MNYRYLVDTTKRAMAKHPGMHIIVDSETDAVIALCPITEANEPICDGHYSFAPLVQNALNSYRPRTDLEIVNQTNDLAKALLTELTGFIAPDDFKMYAPVVSEDGPPPDNVPPGTFFIGGAMEAHKVLERTARAWLLACRIQELITWTDPNDALSALEDEAIAQPEARVTYDMLPLTMDADGIVLASDGSQIASTMPGKRRDEMADFIALVNSTATAQHDDLMSLLAGIDLGGVQSTGSVLPAAHPRFAALGTILEERGWITQVGPDHWKATGLGKAELRKAGIPNGFPWRKTL